MLKILVYRLFFLVFYKFYDLSMTSSIAAFNFTNSQCEPKYYMYFNFTPKCGGI